MKCPGCEYELWNLRAGPCPECGRPFKPSEFDFLANAIKFCCPHCSQAYFGTGAKGELVPGEFDCVSCGRHLTTDDMLLLPADALGKREATRTPNPWLAPHKGAVSRWFTAVGTSLGQPGKMMEATPALGSTGRSLTFAMTNFVVAGLFGLVCAGVSLFMGPRGGGMAFFMMLVVLVPAAYLFIWAATTHGLLKLLRADTEGGMGRTVQAIGFGSGGWVMAIIPCVGMFIGFPAWAICATLAVRAAHKTEGWRASIATLTLPVLTAVTSVVFYGVLMFGVPFMAHSSSSYNPPPMVVTSPSPSTSWPANAAIPSGTQQVADILRQRIFLGTPPRHIASLAGEPGFDPLAFIEPGSGAPAVGSSNIWLLNQMDPYSRDSVVNAEVAQWPAGITAHRLGRIVLTYHGVGAPGSRSGLDLWIMVQLPAGPQDHYWAITPTGYEQIDRTNPQAFVDNQNRLRVAAGLDPLPDMATMLGTGPWTAADGVAPGPP